MNTADPIILSFPKSADADAACHLVRAELQSKRPRALHGHSFYELLWVQNGAVRHYLPGHREDLTEGDMVFIRPGDLHALQGRGEAAMVVSLSIRADVIDAIGARHAGLRNVAFWSDAARPARTHRDIRAMASLNHAALRLERNVPDILALEAFLLPLLSELATTPNDLPEDAPEWLHRACAAAQDPAVFRDGAAGLVRIAGRAHPHVARTMRRYLDMTPSDYVNAVRMRYAARRLLATEDSLTEIAEACGIPNLSHFHRLFLAHHNEPPQGYRRARRERLVQP